MIAPQERPDADQVKITGAMEIPRKARLLYSVDDGAVTTEGARTERWRGLPHGETGGTRHA